MSARRDSSGFPPTLKRLGQHFLADQTALERIVDALAPTEHDTVVEIGPGRGALTDILLPRVGQLVAVELDGALATILQERYADNPRV
ncbi:MAG: rRNA adenine N-6-methyltransferase family protein, partial [Gemmatimonadaceae bacterium]